MPSEPVRMTKGRAHILLELAERGLEEERYSIKEEYGVRFAPDGTIDIQIDEFLVDDPDIVADLGHRLERITDGIAAMTIFANRYT